MSTCYDAQDYGTYELDNPPPSLESLRDLLRDERAQLQQLQQQRARAGIPPVAERGTDGRFRKGNQGGTGNPFARQVADLRKALLDAVTAQDMADVAAALLAKAKEGHVQAIKLFFSYVLGKPTETPNPDRLELEDYELLKARLSPLREDWDKVRDIAPVEAVVAAGHEIADLRAAHCREQVLRHQPAKPATPQPAAAPAGAPESILPRHTGTAEKAAKEALQARTPPSANGSNGTRTPSPNGTHGRPAPSPNGAHGQQAPSPNGVNGASEGECDHFGRAKP